VFRLEYFVLDVAVSLSAIAPATAGEPLSKLWPTWKCWPNCVGTFYCDDYDRKCLPCVPDAACFECPDYCFKPLPCVAPLMNFCCDNYCPKPLPPLCNTSVQGFTCAPNRLPPVNDKTAATQPAVNNSPDGVARPATLPVSSSRRTAHRE